MRPCHESDNLVHQLRQLIRSAGLPAIAERPVADLCSIERMGKERGRALRFPCRTFVLSSSRIDYVHYRRDLRPDRAHVAAARHLGTSAPRQSRRILDLGLSHRAVAACRRDYYPTGLMSAFAFEQAKTCQSAIGPALTVIL